MTVGRCEVLAPVGRTTGDAEVAVTKAARTGLGRWGMAWAGWRLQWRRRRALERAWVTFRARSPGWWHALFDAQLLVRPQARLALEERDAEGLARAWVHQFRYKDLRRQERDVRRVTEVAEMFLGLLAEEEAMLGLS